LVSSLKDFPKMSSVSVDNRKHFTDVTQTHISVDAFLMPYMTEMQYRENRETYSERVEFSEEILTQKESVVEPECFSHSADHYGSNLYQEVSRYAEKVGDIAANLDVDLIHAHDWMTFPAALAARRACHKPVILHVHSLEYDRSGKNVNPQNHHIEGEGLRAADHIIAVSHYTKSIIIKEHGIPEDKISVVHNGQTRKENIKKYHITPKKLSDPKIVLFLGRLTFQKGPEYFVAAAVKVASIYPNVKFVISGSGDQLEATKYRVHKTGISEKFEFTGFLRGEEVERMYAKADLYVMPSVSEPFGLTPLEAISCDTPVIVSKQSGISEVLNHALKVNFWDVDRMAEMILSVLEHQALTSDMLEMAKQELLSLHWDAAASKCCDIYKKMSI
jgi:glycosyltransferase involved in cell wall biosynthesis